MAERKGLVRQIGIAQHLQDLTRPGAHQHQRGQIVTSRLGCRPPSFGHLTAHVIKIMRRKAGAGDHIEGIRIKPAPP